MSEEAYDDGQSLPWGRDYQFVIHLPRETSRKDLHTALEVYGDFDPQSIVPLALQPPTEPPEILADKTEFQQQEQDPDNGEYIPIYTWVYKNVYDPYRIAEQMQRDASSRKLGDVKVAVVSEARNTQGQGQSAPSKAWTVSSSASSIRSPPIVQQTPNKGGPSRSSFDPRPASRTQGHSRSSGRSQSPISSRVASISLEDPGNGALSNSSMSSRAPSRAQDEKRRHPAPSAKETQPQHQRATHQDQRERIGSRPRHQVTTSYPERVRGRQASASYREPSSRHEVDPELWSMFRHLAPSDHIKFHRKEWYQNLSEAEQNEYYRFLEAMDAERWSRFRGRTLEEHRRRGGKGWYRDLSERGQRDFHRFLQEQVEVWHVRMQRPYTSRERGRGGCGIM